MPLPSRTHTEIPVSNNIAVDFRGGTGGSVTFSTYQGIRMQAVLTILSEAKDK